VKNKKPRMNLTYILKKKKDKVAADVEDLKVRAALVTLWSQVFQIK
jgi:hypothetical protein